ncbi:MAG: hypothetical protein A2538_03880 [Candidatus Magasanikbacteria bacterium RIFOXYD2_FULL_41_14]|uniref:Nucleoid-associated protein n=1 Tax=Candidatus Magasanikbacteria bacterium RIFOXYD2_FULL_41_14 TaxID=1798709 RepID=A0A1F6PCT5_9BACT|nr:MAG: hypothetical protein A2538_03880 [Candidatus Magasanikbacteria bacterium RIFOXYD2_FULL_41_14]
MTMLGKLKQFKDLREQGKKMQTLLADESTTATAAGGKVAVTLDGNLQMSGCAVDAELLNPNQKIKLENAIKDAHNDAMKKIQRVITTKMQQSGDFKMPGMS